MSAARRWFRIPGGEPLLHPQIDEIVEGLVARKKYIYLCTNALLLKEKIDLFTPSKYLTFSVHMDGQKEHHDFAVCREGGYEIAVDGIREAVKRGFRVTTNTTLFDGADPKSVRAFFDEMMDLGVEGMMLSPGYSYDKAPDQQHFLGTARTRRLFRDDPHQPQERLALQPVAAVPRIPDGQAALRLHAVGHADVQHLRLAEAVLPAAGRLRRHVRGTDRETAWESYGTETGNPKCANCMVHSGYEASAVNDTFGSLKGFVATVKGTLFNRYRDEGALRLLDEPIEPAHSLVQIAAPSESLEETRA